MTPQSTSTNWLRERLHDLMLWPFNLVRDLPRRTSRLLQTIWSGCLGFVSVPSEFIRVHQARQHKNWLRYKSRRFFHGLHLLFVQLFDLAGGPEIAQFFMHLITHTTPLTDEEIALIAGTLKPAGMRYQDIRVAEGGLLEKVFEVNGRLAFTTWYTINLPKSSKRFRQHSRQNKALLAHEFFHTYQYEKVGSRYMTEAIYVLKKTKRNCYQYGGSAGLQLALNNHKSFRQFNREQQAQIFQDFFSRRQNNRDTTAYIPYIRQLQENQL